MALTKVSRGLLTTSIVDNGNATAITIDSSENVGIGVSNPSDYYAKDLVIGAADEGGITIESAATEKTYLLFAKGTSGDAQYRGFIGYDHNIDSFNISSNGYINFLAGDTGANAERMRIDASGNLLVGTTDTAPGAGDTNPGVSIRGGSDNRSYFSVNGDYVMHLNRNTNDGSILEFARRGTNVASIGIDNIDLFVSFSQTNNIGIKSGVTGGTPVLFPCGNTGSARDNAASWGYANGRWKEIFAVNDSINTSDRNEKQDIAELTDAEQRVAVACKGLLRKFRWIDAVEAKGDDARIHFGIIAQDLQAAFEAEGLDAARYAMFTSNTWWETQTEVAAVEATEDSEAVDAYTRTDTYDAAEEAPEGATERTRLGVRYSELLAFIISAI